MLASRFEQEARRPGGSLFDELLLIF